MRLPDECGVITNRAIRGGVLDECAENGVVEFEPRVIVDLDLDAKRLRAGLNDGNSLGMTIVVWKFTIASKRPCANSAWYGV